MKKFLASFLLIFALLPSCFALADNRNTTVHITNTGSCYHSSGCSYLKSDHMVTLEYALKKGLRACSRCSPPQPNFDPYKTSTTYTYTYQPQQQQQASVASSAAPAVGFAASGGALAGFFAGRMSAPTSDERKRR